MTPLDRIAMVEHLAIRSHHTLHSFCERFRQLLNLPEFQFSFENETEWGLVELEGIEYNVARPYDVGTLQKWDDTVPVGCNFGISLIVDRQRTQSGERDWTLNHLVAPIGQTLANGFAAPVYYHRTWNGPGENVTKNFSFYPDSA